MSNASRALVRGFVFTLAAASLGQARADVRLAGIFGDHMVLQRHARARFWGSASPGELIRVRPSWYENDAAVTAGPDGRFLVTLTTPGDPGPHTIRFSGQDEVTLSDVLLGEVWLASGQSNMEMGVGFMHRGYAGVLNWEEELADANRPRIRLFTVENAASPGPQSEVRGSWSAANAASVKEFSASAWFFAKRLERELDVPIGVVAADYGGTPAEAWTSAKALAPFPQFAPSLAECARLASDPRTAEAVRTGAPGPFGRLIARIDPLSVAHAEAPGFDDSGWTPIRLPGGWTGELGRFDGLAWFRREIEIPAAWAGHDLELSLGAIDDDDRTWFNGEWIGGTEGWDVARHYEIDGERVKAGRATLAVRVLDTGGEGGFRGQPAELSIRRAGKAEKIPLAGTWRMARGAALADLPAKPAGFVVGGNTPSALFNGMIAPLGEFRFAGVIWYQGESNVGRAEEYAELFPALIHDWRAHFHGELPFLFVQIAPYAYGNDLGAAGDLRAAQAVALELPKTAMVVTLDIGDAADIHPKNKQEVGRRLALLALRDVYGRPAELRPAPVATGATREAGLVTLRFHPPELLFGDSAEGRAPSAFELAGSDGRFHPAAQVEVGPGEVQLQSDAVPEPVAVRYAWGAAAGPSIRVGEDQMPIAPFRIEVR